MTINYATTETRARKHHVDEGIVRCSIDNVTVPLTDEEAADMKLCFLCSSLPAPTPAPVETKPEPQAPAEDTTPVRIGELVMNFIRANVLDLEDPEDADLAAIIDATSPRRFGGGYRYTLHLTTDQRVQLANAVLALHALMAAKMVRPKDTGFGASNGWLLELAARISG